MKVKSEEEASKLDGLDQYGRRQNLRFEGVLLTEDEDVVDLVVRIGKLVGAKLKRDDISTAHRLPLKRHCKILLSWDHCTIHKSKCPKRDLQ